MNIAEAAKIATYKWNNAYINGIPNTQIMDTNFKEEEHPRDEDGKFTKGAGGSTPSEEEHRKNIAELESILPQSKKAEKPTKTAPTRQQIAEMNTRLKEKMFGNPDISPGTIKEQARQEAKAELVKKLSDRLEKDEAFMSWVMSGLAAGKSTPKAQIAEQANKSVSVLIQTWAQTSADNHPKAILLQKTALKTFGLTDASIDHLPDIVSKAEYEEALAKKQALKEKAEEIKKLQNISDEDWYKLSKEEQTEYPKKIKAISDEARKIDDETNKVIASYQKSASATNLEELDTKTATAYASFLKAQYDETQAFFKSAGITHVQVFRGMKTQAPTADKSEHKSALEKKNKIITDMETISESYEELDNQQGYLLEKLEGETDEKNIVKLQKQLKVVADRIVELDEKSKLKSKELTEAVEHLSKFADAAKADNAATLALQPISSFSTSYEVAKDFAGATQNALIISASIPVEHILSTCRTGFGCLSEGEVTVLAHKLEGKVLGYDTASKDYGGFPYDEAGFLKAVGMELPDKGEKVSDEEKEETAYKEWKKKNAYEYPDYDDKELKTMYQLDTGGDFDAPVKGKGHDTADAFYIETALATDLEDEHKAVEQYNLHIKNISNPAIKKKLIEIRDEELHHIKELTELLSKEGIK